MLCMVLTLAKYSIISFQRETFSLRRKMSWKLTETLFFIAFVFINVMTLQKFFFYIKTSKHNFAIINPPFYKEEKL